jgi:beta-N-acetylhexosaminidase
MVGHATLSAVDNQNPASLSRQVIDQIVRQHWGHDGILITDDLSMGPVVRHGLCQAGVDAINAGIDLLLVSYDTEQYFTVFHCLQQAARANTIDQTVFKASQQRLGALHRSIGVAPDLREKQL